MRLYWRDYDMELSQQDSSKTDDISSSWQAFKLLLDGLSVSERRNLLCGTSHITLQVSHGVKSMRHFLTASILDSRPHQNVWTEEVSESIFRKWCPDPASKD